jgi:chorismate dehydratase
MYHEKIKVSVVKYLNSVPFVYGLEKFSGGLQIEMFFDTPADCAKKLKSGEVDLGLIPVSEISSLPESYVISDYCIGAEGPVFSVCLAGDRPIDQLKRIYLDSHSRTSVNLAKILAAELWKKEFNWLEAGPNFEKDLIKQADGGVVIGDKVFGISGKYLYQYDLAEEWKKLTGLPFVFAAWVSNRPLEEEWISDFNRALSFGVQSIPEVLERYSGEYKLHGADLLDYLSNKISYPFDKQKRAGMALFLQKLKNIK